MKLPPRIAPRPSRLASRVLAALALSALPAVGAVTYTFDTDTQGIDGSGASWSTKFGGSLAITTNANWSPVAQLAPTGAFATELNTCLTNGGVLEFDIIVDSEGIPADGSLSPYLAANSTGGWDQENNFPTITAAQVAGGPVTIHVARLVMPNDPFIGNDGEFHFASSSNYFQLNFGRVDTGTTGTTTFHIDNLTLTANPTALPIANPYASEAITFDTNTSGFSSLSWEPTASTTHDALLGGMLKISLSAPAPKGFWWATSGSMPSKFSLKFNAAITGGGLLSFDLVAPAGTLGSFTPYIYSQMSGGNYTWTQYAATIDPARIVSLSGGLEKISLVVPMSAFGFVPAGSVTGAVAYGTLGFGLGFPTDIDTSTTPVVYYIDNIAITPAQRSAALSFDTDAENFTAIPETRDTTTDSTDTSATVTVADASGLAVGWIASGNANLPEGATITAISGLSVTLSAPATGTAAAVPTTFTAPINPAAVWSPGYGGTLAVTAPGGAGESFRLLAESLVNPAFNVAFNQILSTGGSVSYDLIAPSGVLSTLKPFLFTQQRTGDYTWVSNQGSATFISPANVTALPSGLELTRVTIPTSAFAAPLTNPYSLLGLGAVYTSSTPVNFHVDNIQVETALVPTTSAITYDTSLESFIPYLLGGVVHWTRVDSAAAGNGKSMLISGRPAGQQWLARATLTSTSSGAEAKALAAKLVAASANGGTLEFDVVVDDFSVTNPNSDFATAGLGAKLSLQTQGTTFQQKLFPLTGVTLPLASGASAVVHMSVPLYKNGSTETDGFVVATGTAFEILIGSDCPETLVATADTTTTSGSAIVTVADTTGIVAGLTVNSANLPNATTVVSVDGATQLTLSAAATATGLSAGATYTRPTADRVDLIIDNLSVTANPDPVAPVISSPPRINLDGQWVAGRVLAAFAEGAVYSATGLPAGLSLDPATGVISGRPSANGSFTVVFTVTTAAGVATSEVSWSVTGAGTANLVVTSFQVVAGAATIQWTGAAGNPVTVQRSTDLVSWTDLATGVTAETYTDAVAPTPRAFYRVVLP